MPYERLLHLDRRRHAGARRGKYREERVPLGVHLLTVVRREASPDEPVMIGEDLRVRVAQAPEHRGRARDVSEEKRERLGGQQPGASV